MENLYEVQLGGYDGNTDATDHLILWGAADSLEQVQKNFPESKCQQLPFSIEKMVKPDFDLRGA